MLSILFFICLILLFVERTDLEYEHNKNKIKILKQ